jgi:hypothetical protein
VLRVDVAVFEEIESDPAATTQAVLVIATASVAAGVGAALRLGPSAFPAVAAASAGGWLLWAGLIYLIGRRMLPEPQTSAPWGGLFRVVGFAAAPGVFLVSPMPALGVVALGWIAYMVLLALLQM